jgi:hypothetical protein
MSDNFQVFGRDPAPDPNAGLRQMIATETATLDAAEAFHSAGPNGVRPIGNPYLGDPAAITARRQYLADMKTRAGIVDPPPEEAAAIAAEARFEASYAMPEMPEQLTELLENQIEQIEAVPHEHARMAAEMVAHYGGPEAYQRVVAEAQAGVHEPLSPVMKLSRHLLDVLATYGRANIARDNAIAARGR